MKDILLESGNGEVEIIVFIINNKKYCINVLKTREIVVLKSVSPMPGSDDCIKGLTDIRGHIHTVIDLPYILEGTHTPTPKEPYALVCEFNKTQYVFLVDAVEGIKRIPWSEIKKPDSLLNRDLIMGTILSGDDIYVLLDFESIVTDKVQNLYVDTQQEMGGPGTNARSEKTIFIAEDSHLIQNLIVATLQKAGYVNVVKHSDGLELLERLNTLVKEEKESVVDLVITDVEMPGLDGLSLTKQIKDNPKLTHLPVILYSSLITDDLKHKGQSVGANAQISKPEITELISVVDKLLQV